MAADRIARPSELNQVRLHAGRVIALLAATIGVLAALLIILTSAV